MKYWKSISKIHGLLFDINLKKHFQTDCDILKISINEKTIKLIN